LRSLRLFGREFVLKLRHLLLQLRHPVGGRVTIRIRWSVHRGITIRIRGVIRGWTADQRIPFFLRLMQIQGRLTVESETQQQQSGYRRHS
jgi:hypothetical protein